MYASGGDAPQDLYADLNTATHRVTLHGKDEMVQAKQKQREKAQLSIGVALQLYPVSPGRTGRLLD
jgi:hypothetical protein